MNIFTRQAVLRGSPADVMPWAIEVTEYVREHSEFDISLWMPQFGAPLGSVAWSARIDSLTELEANFDRLSQDEGYLKLVARAQDFYAGIPSEDILRRSIHLTTNTTGEMAVGSFVELTTAVPAAGRMADAMGFGVEISDMHASITDAPVGFFSDAYGDFGRMTWYALFPTAQDVDAAAEALAKDADYGAKIDGAGELFEPGQARRGLARRVA